MAQVSEIKSFFVKPFKALDMKKIVDKAFRDNEQKIVELNRHQMDEGVKADGTDIRPYYRPFTIKLKKERGQPYDRVTLHDTGDFYRGMKFNARKNLNGVKITSTDWKTQELVDKYTPDIFGIADELKPVVANVVKPEIGKLIKQTLRL